jgi:hypothetical protein
VPSHRLFNAQVALHKIDAKGCSRERNATRARKVNDSA